MHRKIRVLFSIETADPWILRVYKSFYDGLASLPYELFCTACDVKEPAGQLDAYHIIDYAKLPDLAPALAACGPVGTPSRRLLELAPGFALWDSPQRLLERFDRFRSAFHIVQPDLVIVWNGMADIRRMIRIFLSEQSTPFFYAEKGMLPDSWYIDEAGINACCSLRPSVANAGIPESQRDRVEQYLQNVISSGSSAWQQPAGISGDALRRKLSIAVNSPVIFFPGWVDEDTSITELSCFKTVAEAVGAVADAMPSGATLIVKPHPKSKTESRQQLQELAPQSPNLRIVTDADIWDLIDVADLVVSINSTVAFESLLGKRKLLLLGDNILSKVGLVEKVNVAELKDALKASLEGSFDNRVNYSRVLSFVKFLLDDYYLFTGCSSVPQSVLSRIDSKAIKASDKTFSVDKLKEILYPHENTILPSGPVTGESFDPAVACFRKAVDRFAAGNFQQAVELMEQYRRAIDYTKLPRTTKTRNKSSDVQVSVIIVTYNRTEELKNCLESLSKQNEENFEVVIVDNGGTNLNELGNDFDQYIKCPMNFSLSEGRNIGAFFAKGAILAFLDDDAVVGPDYISSIRTAFKTYDICGLRGRALPKSSQNTNNGTKGYDHGPNPFPTVCDLEGGSAFSREIFLSINGMDPLLFGHEGYDLTYRIAKNSDMLNSIIYWPYTIIYHDAPSTDSQGQKDQRYSFNEQYLRFKHSDHIFSLRDEIEKCYLPGPPGDACPEQPVVGEIEPHRGAGNVTAQPSHTGPAAAPQNDVPVALVVYNRPKHTLEVLKSLRGHNVQNLYIFCDAPKRPEHEQDVSLVRRLVHSINWTTPEIIEREQNFGLAKSITSATDFVFERHDRLILLEDDCVPQQHFFDFMCTCLEKYKDNPKVFGVAGYSISMPDELLREYPYDLYFCPRICSWGWATWKRAWKYYDRDLQKLVEEANERGIDLAQGGSEVQVFIEKFLRGRLNDVWTLNWILTVYLNNGYYAYPTSSHIKNVGMDGSGLHCRKTTKYDSVCADAKPHRYPDRIILNDQFLERFRKHFDFDEEQSRKAAVFLSTIKKHQTQRLTSEKPALSANKPATPSRYLVSAIVSTYNSQESIRGCIENLESQTIADKLEIIVVDSGSQQNEQAVVAELQQKYDNIKYIKTAQRETIYAAWNKAVKAATGKYITNANTDDRRYEDALEIMANALDRDPDGVLVYGDNEIIDAETGAVVGKTTRSDFTMARLLDHCFVGPQPMWRRELHDEFGYFDESFFSAGDYEFWLRIAQKYEFMYLTMVLGQYQRRSDSIEHSNGGWVGRFETALIKKAYQYASINSIFIGSAGLTGTSPFTDWCETNIVKRQTAQILTGRPVEPVEKVDDNRNPDTVPLLSIIIATFNRTDGLLKCIGALAGQSESDFELIVVNNGLTIIPLADNRRYPFGVCCMDLKSNYGPSLARNIGAGFAKAPYIAFLDDDAIADENFVRNILRHFNETDISGLRGKALPESGDRKPDHYDLGDEPMPFLVDLEGNCAFKKDVLLEVGGFDEFLFHTEGQELSYRIFRHQKESLNALMYFPDVVIYHDPRNVDDAGGIEKTLRSQVMAEMLARKAHGIRKYIRFFSNFYPANRATLESNFFRLMVNVSFLEKNYPDLALFWALKAIAIEPDNVPCRYAVGRMNVRLGRFDVAERFLEPLSRQLYIAVAQDNISSLGESFKDEKSATLCYIDAAMKLAFSYAQQGKSRQAAAAYSQILNCSFITLSDQQKDCISKEIDRLTESPVTVMPQQQDASVTDSLSQKGAYLVSAIVSTYNAQEFIRGCLEDLERQTIADQTEIIVVNSGSQQNDEQIVKEFQKRYSNIVYIKTEHREPLYSAWNRAIKAASGRFLTNANTDDRHRKDAMEIMADTLTANPDVALVYGDQIVTDTPNGTFENHHAVEMTKRPEFSWQRLLFGCCVGSQPMWRKSLHDEFAGFDESLTCAADWDFWLKVAKKHSFKHIPQFLGLYYRNKDGIEHGRKIHSLYERYAVGRRYGNPYISVIPLYQAPDNPLVSIVITAYNSAGYIARAIESVLIQNYRNFELIVVDDGSTDNTADIVRSFTNEPIKYFFKENGGVASARNFGLKKSTGSFIVMLDSDDMMTPNYLAEHLKGFVQYPQADMVYCDEYLIDEQDQPIRVIHRPQYSDSQAIIADMFHSGWPVVHFKTCIKRSVFDKIGLYDERLIVAEDYDMMRRFIKQGLKMHRLPEALYLRRLRQESLSKTYDTAKAKSHFDVVHRFTETFTPEQLFPDVVWNKLPAGQKPLLAKCKAALVYLDIGQKYLGSNAADYAAVAFDLACTQLDDCCRIEPANQNIINLRGKCRSIRDRHLQPVA